MITMLILFIATCFGFSGTGSSRKVKKYTKNFPFALEVLDTFAIQFKHYILIYTLDFIFVKFRSQIFEKVPF
jgi:hypothetical protein